MRYINQIKMCLILGLAAVSIPVAAYVGRSMPSVDEVQVEPARHTAGGHGTAGKAAISSARQPQDYYDRRREYWERRLERGLEESDEMDEENGDTNAKSANEDSKDSKAEDEGGDLEEDDIERRREYWRQRLDRDW